VAVPEPISDPNTSVPPTSAASAGSTSAGSTGPTSSTSTSASIAETVQMVKDYARQETLDPLKTAGRWVGLGLAGALLIGVATGFLALGVIRMMQTEWPGTFGGRWTHLLPYLAGVTLCVLVVGLAVRRINKDPLTKEKR
jgi:uncharacterized membrane protein YidH (DUF202 family)